MRWPRGRNLPDAGEKGEPAHLRHALVANDDVEVQPRRDLQALRWRGGETELDIRLRGEHAFDQVQRQRLIVDRQQAVGNHLRRHAFFCSTPVTKTSRNRPLTNIYMRALTCGGGSAHLDLSNPAPPDARATRSRRCADDSGRSTSVLRACDALVAARRAAVGPLPRGPD